MRATTIGGPNAFLLEHCALRKFHVSNDQNKTRMIRLRGVEGRNARDQIVFLVVRSLNEYWLHTCDACVMTTWRLGLRAPVVALTKS